MHLVVQSPQWKQQDKMYEIYLKLTLKTPEQRRDVLFIFITDFDQVNADGVHATGTLRLRFGFTFVPRTHQLTP